MAVRPFNDTYSNQILILVGRGPTTNVYNKIPTIQYWVPPTFGTNPMVRVEVIVLVVWLPCEPLPGYYRQLLVVVVTTWYGVFLLNT